MKIAQLTKNLRPRIESLMPLKINRELRGRELRGRELRGRELRGRELRGSDCITI